MIECTHHWKRLGLALLPRWKLAQRHLQALGLDPQTGRHGVGRRHPYIRVWRVLHLGTDSKALLFGRQDVEHSFAGDERRRAKRYFQLIASAVVVAADLLWALWHSEAIEGRHPRGIEVVQGCVDVPAVESCDTLRLVLR